MKYVIDTVFLIKKMPNYKILILSTLLVGITEAIGLSALVPVVSYFISGDDSGLAPPFDSIPKIFEIIGLEVSFANLLIATLPLLLASFFASFFQSFVQADANAKYLLKTREVLTENIFNSKFEFLNKLKSGHVTNVVINESERSAEALMSLVNIFATVVIFTVYLAVTIILSWELSLIAISMTILVAFFGRGKIKNARGFGKSRLEMQNEYSKIFHEYFRGIKLIKSTALIDFIIPRLRQCNIQTAAALKKIFLGPAKLRLELQCLVAIALVTIMYLSVNIFQIDATVILIFVYIVLRLTPKISLIQSQMHNFSSHYPSMLAINMLLENTAKNADLRSDSLGTVKFDESITLNNVCFRYEGGSKNAVNGINLRIKKNTTVAFIGKSGAGKSTLVDIIIGLLPPSQGFLELDDVPMSAALRQSYCEQIGYVTQESVFLSGSLRDNLCFGKSVDDNFIWECLETAQIKSFVESLPGKLEFKVEEAGNNFSGGQRQRLSIARALVRRPALLVLDEATSSLDVESESDFQRAISRVAGEFTVLVVAHRLSTIKQADIIYVIENGEIIDSGTYTEIFDARQNAFGVVASELQLLDSDNGN